MRTASVYSLGDPGSFDLTDKDIPGYYIARASHEISENLYNLQGQGFEWRQETNTDVSGISSTFNTWIASFLTWSEDAIAASNDDLPIPTPPYVGALPAVAGIPGILVTIVGRILINTWVKWLEQRLEPGEGGSEVAKVLRQALIGEIEEEEFPLIELLANTPLEIIISRIGEYQDFLYSDRPLV